MRKVTSYAPGLLIFNRSGRDWVPQQYFKKVVTYNRIAKHNVRRRRRQAIGEIIILLILGPGIAIFLWAIYHIAYHIPF